MAWQRQLAQRTAEPIVRAIELELAARRRVERALKAELRALRESWFGVTSARVKAPSSGPPTPRRRRPAVAAPKRVSRAARRGQVQLVMGMVERAFDVGAAVVPPVLEELSNREAASVIAQATVGDGVRRRPGRRMLVGHAALAYAEETGATLSLFAASPFDAPDVYQAPRAELAIADARRIVRTAPQRVYVYAPAAWRPGAAS